MNQLFVEYTDYDLFPPIDINPIKVMVFEKPIIVCAREGQKVRLAKMQKLGILPPRVTIMGWWDLGGIPVDELLVYDGIFILDPDRIGVPAAKAQWARIIECLK